MHGHVDAPDGHYCRLTNSGPRALSYQPEYPLVTNLPFAYRTTETSLIDDVARTEELRRRLLEWYGKHRRDLPWRGETDPYRILISEVMLQQTRVGRVRSYYDRFLAEFPDFATLAAAPRIDVLRVWGGLGYNRRAVYLHECAKAVVERHGGALPSDPDLLAKLPGIGPYTQAAVLSFAFGKDVATIDTNVRRVVDRLVFGGDAPRSEVESAAARLVPGGRSSDWNQALMDFGSLQCSAGSPDCPACLLRDLCAAFEQPLARQPLRVAEPAEPFVGSRRYLRGRIVARLRELPARSTIPLSDFRDLLTDPDVDQRLIDLARGLAAHGLARIIEDADGVRIGPPH